MSGVSTTTQDFRGHRCIVCASDHSLVLRYHVLDVHRRVPSCGISRTSVAASQYGVKMLKNLLSPPGLQADTVHAEGPSTHGDAETVPKQSEYFSGGPLKKKKISGEEKAK